MMITNTNMKDAQYTDKLCILGNLSQSYDSIVIMLSSCTLILMYRHCLSLSLSTSKQTFVFSHINGTHLIRIGLSWYRIVIESICPLSYNRYERHYHVKHKSFFIAHT